MTGPRTVADAGAYWRDYYAEQFRFGQGTEDILALLTRVPPARRWADLGCGSESMLWAIGLRAARLTAVDDDPARLEILRRFTAAARPRGLHRTALSLCGRRATTDFSTRCRSLAATVRADCLRGEPFQHPALPEAGFELVTQFGLLGLCRDPAQFTRCLTAHARMLAPGGWIAGANWVAADPTGRVPLTADLYRHATEQAGVHLTDLHRIPITTDPGFTAVWAYRGRTR